ncbi:hypothetical protein GCM10023238_11410 [Streptomyces heliomycini]
MLRALGYDAKPRVLSVERAGRAYEVPVARAEKGLVALDCGWAAEPDAALDPKGRGRLLEPVRWTAPTRWRPAPSSPPSCSPARNRPGMCCCSAAV